MHRNVLLLYTNDDSSGFLWEIAIIWGIYERRGKEKANGFNCVNINKFITIELNTYRWGAVVEER